MPEPDQVPGLTPLSTGEVRDLYANAAGEPATLAGHRLSAFDQVLPTTVPGKGRLLILLSPWWFERFGDLVPNHVPPDAPPEDAPTGRAGRTLVRQRLEVVPVECVARHGLAPGPGSSRTGPGARFARCGAPILEGMTDGSEPSEAVCTPAAKVEVGDPASNTPSPALPNDVVERTLSRYTEIYERLTGTKPDL